MSNKSRLGQQWYIYDDATGECETVHVNDETPNTVQLIMEDGSMKRFYKEYVNFVEKVIPRTIQ